jgi:hypothetical protein
MPKNNNNEKYETGDSNTHSEEDAKLQYKSRGKIRDSAIPGQNHSSK